jgi:hypothetical protein
MLEVTVALAVVEMVGIQLVAVLEHQVKDLQGRQVLFKAHNMVAVAVVVLVLLELLALLLVVLESVVMVEQA